MKNLEYYYVFSIVRATIKNPSLPTAFLSPRLFFFLVKSIVMIIMYDADILSILDVSLSAHI